MTRSPAPLRLAFALAVRLLPAEVRRRHSDEMAVHVTAIYAAARRRGRTAAAAESLAEIADIAGAGMAARLPRGRRRAAAGSGGGSSVTHDLRHAWRGLARRPGHALLTIATLALGIGASTAVFSVVDTLLLRPLPFRDPPRLVELNTRLPQRDITVHFIPARFAHAWRGQADLFEGVEYYDDDSVVLGGAEPQHVSSTDVTPGLFALLGAAPAIGRPFTDADALAPANVAIISDAQWARFGRDPGILGRTLLLDDRAHEVVGVMPPDFRFPAGGSNVWRPLQLSSLRPSQGVATVARLADDLPLPVAQERADAAIAGFQEDRAADERLGVQLRPLGGTRTDADTRRALYLLLGAVGFVLLIGCANAANLALTQGVARAQELSVRAALGAGRGRLLRGLLTENLALGVAGGGLGVLLARAILAAMLDLAPVEITRQTFSEIAVDPRILVVALAVSVATGLLFGSLPAWRAGRADPAAALNQGGRAATASRTERRVGGALVVGEVALSLVLLSGAGLLIHSFARLQRVEPGFDVRTLAVTGLQLPTDRYPSGAARLAFLEQVVERVRILPDVAAVTIAGGAPPGSGSIVFDITPEAEGGPPVPFPSSAYLPVVPISPDYFATLGIPLREGRTFTLAEHNQPVTIVSETLARRYWGEASPIGRRFRFDADEEWLTVVGVAADVKQMGYDDPNEIDMEVYRPLSRGERAHNYYTLVVRASADPRPLLPAINTIVWALDGRLPIARASTIEALYAETLREERFYLSLMAAFALVAGLLATVGIYGVVSYWAGQRTREFGLRLALGATARDLRSLVLRNGLQLAALGIALGLGAAIPLTRLLDAQLFEVPPADPITLTAAAVVLGAVALAASYVPARRACRIDPMQALRME